MKKNYILKYFILLLLLITSSANAQSGYIYVHKKASSELGSPDFTFNLKQGATTIQSFSLNDKPDVLNAFDLGNSHGVGEGQLWAVVNAGNATANTHGVNGTLYTRPANSAAWNITSATNVRSVDGVAANTAVYSNNNGAVSLYNGVTNTSTIIWTPGTATATGHIGNITVLDVASGGTVGSIVVAASDGRMYKYIGDGTTDRWSVFTNIPTASTLGNIYRVDVNPTDLRVVYFRSGNTSVYTIANVANTPALNIIAIAGPTAATSAGAALQDIAVSNEGRIFATYISGTSGENVIFEYSGTSWNDNAKSRGLSGITAGIGNQAWALAKVNVGEDTAHSIFTRAIPGTTGNPVNPAIADWIDDERVRTIIPNGNVIMIPVPAGTYTITENATAGWSNSEITLYDPTTNSTASTITSTSTINVAAGEVVHVVYSNALQNSVPVPAECRTNYVVTFGKGAPTYGDPFSGFTSYHHRPASGIVGDGYYAVVKDNTQFYTYTPAILVKNHTPVNPALPPNPVTNPPDPDGYFGMFNAAYATNDFFRQTITGLVIGIKYEFAFWAANLTPSTAIKPNVTAGVINPATGLTVASIPTGDILTAVWQQYTVNFTANSTTVEIFLKNNAIGGSGNDIAIDDVSFAPAPAVLLPSTGPAGITLFCNSPATTYQFTNATAGASGGSWTTTTPLLVTVNSTTGQVTTIANAVGTATVVYTYTSPSGCVSTDMISITVGNCACYNSPVAGPGGIATKHGITLLQRAGASPASPNNWPMVRIGAFTALESNTKGFVITRIAGTSGILKPVEGMMVYDTVAGCLKIYDGLIWSCFLTPACP